MAQASGEASVGVGEVWRTMTCYWCVTVKAVGEHIT